MNNIGRECVKGKEEGGWGLDPSLAGLKKGSKWRHMPINLCVFLFSAAVSTLLPPQSYSQFVLRVPRSEGTVVCFISVSISPCAVSHITHLSMFAITNKMK